VKHPGEHLQLAKTMDMSKIHLPARAELKLDGIRAVYFQGKFYTRAGKEIVLPKATELFAPARGHVIDIEITLESGKLVDRPTVSGMVNSAIKGGKINESHLYFNIIDCISAVDYVDERATETYDMRLTKIDIFIEQANCRQIRAIPFVDVNTLDELSLEYDRRVADGYEGIVVKNYADQYQYKRSKQWARFKEVRTADLICVMTVDGKGKYTGMIGALQLVGVVEGKYIEVKVGSGMTDYDRGINPDFYLKKIIEVKYNSITRDSITGQASLFLPRFVMVREDK